MAKGGPGFDQARYGPYVPAQTVLRLLDERVPEETQFRRVEAAGVSGRTLWELRKGHRRWLRFETADRIIGGAIGDESLWHSEPELAALYGRD